MSHRPFRSPPHRHNPTPLAPLPSKTAAAVFNAARRAGITTTDQRAWIEKCGGPVVTKWLWYVLPACAALAAWLVPPVDGGVPPSHAAVFNAAGPVARLGSPQLSTSPVRFARGPEPRDIREVVVLPAQGTQGPLTIFSAFTEQDGREPWVSTGTADTVRLLKDIRVGKPGSDPRDFFVFPAYGTQGPVVLFTANDGVNGRELWRTLGTEQTTVLLKDINPGAGSSEPSDFLFLPGSGTQGPELRFWADDGVNGRRVWVTRGTRESTQLLRPVEK
jgi:ELWxxDGT repeat protein